MTSTAIAGQNTGNTAVGIQFLAGAFGLLSFPRLPTELSNDTGSLTLGVKRQEPEVLPARSRAAILVPSHPYVNTAVRKHRLKSAPLCSTGTKSCNSVCVSIVIAFDN
jgi:hypothetical protein